MRPWYEVFPYQRASFCRKEVVEFGTIHFETPDDGNHYHKVMNRSSSRDDLTFQRIYHVFDEEKILEQTANAESRSFVVDANRQSHNVN
jgi:hypothetical protein